MTETKEERKARKAALRNKKLMESVNRKDPNKSHINVLCVRFGDKYSQDYVVKLRNMVSRHLDVPYTFYCLTDDDNPIEGVELILRPNQGYAKGWWHKVHMFDPELPIEGRILYMDLDVVICNSINKLAMLWRDDFIGIRDFNRKFHKSYQYLNSSVLAWNKGTQDYIYTKFKQNPDAAMRMAGDQDWIWKLGRPQLKFWPEEWIRSYKWEIRDRSELRLEGRNRIFKTQRNDIHPGAECSIAVFHGEPNPSQVNDKFVVDNWK